MFKRSDYRRRYLRLTNELEELLAGYNCGIALASFVNPRIEQLQRELDTLVDEVKGEMAKNGSAGSN